ncbi:hypothetical protein Pelo_2612 [Pelomyxa schiedti]|nr:hypothetical protein Pelo_2612 [Pelomyxa schiedti]
MTRILLFYWPLKLLFTTTYYSKNAKYCPRVTFLWKQPYRLARSHARYAVFHIGLRAAYFAHAKCLTVHGGTDTE